MTFGLNTITDVYVPIGNVSRILPRRNADWFPSHQAADPLRAIAQHAATGTGWAVILFDPIGHAQLVVERALADLDASQLECDVVGLKDPVRPSPIVGQPEWLSDSEWHSSKAMAITRRGAIAILQSAFEAGDEPPMTAQQIDTYVDHHMRRQGLRAIHLNAKYEPQAAHAPPHARKALSSPTTRPMAETLGRRSLIAICGPNEWTALGSIARQLAIRLRPHVFLTYHTGRASHRQLPDIAGVETVVCTSCDLKSRLPVGAIITVGAPNHPIRQWAKKYKTPIIVWDNPAEQLKSRFAPLVSKWICMTDQSRVKVERITNGHDGDSLIWQCPVPVSLEFDVQPGKDPKSFAYFANGHADDDSKIADIINRTPGLAWTVITRRNARQWSAPTVRVITTEDIDVALIGVSHVVAPTRHNLGMAALEAMAKGRHVITRQKNRDLHDLILTAAAMHSSDLRSAGLRNRSYIEQRHAWCDIIEPLERMLNVYTGRTQAT